MAEITGPALLVSHCALSLHEVLHNIFNQLHCPPSLACAACVSPAWFEAAVSVLWRAPPSEALGVVSDEARRAVCARAVRRLSINDTHDAAAWSFPAVTVLDYEFNDHADDIKLKNAMARCGPSLSAIELSVDLRERNRLPLDLDFMHEDLLTPACLKLVVMNAGITRFYTSCLVRADALNSLATCATTTVARAASPKADDHPLPQAPQPPHSSALQTLSLSVIDVDVPLLVDTLLCLGAPVTTLALRLLSGDEPFSFWRALGRLAGLRELCVEFDVPVHAAKSFVDDFSALGSLPRQLRVLRVLVGEHSAALPAPTAEQWHVVAERLPELETLRVDVKSPMGGGLLRLLGEQCRRLRELHVAYVPCHLAALDGAAGAALFPQLRALDVDTFAKFERIG